MKLVVTRPARKSGSSSTAARNGRLELTPRMRNSAMARRARLVAQGVALVLVALIWLGSNQLANFDSALIGYAVGIVALTYAVVMRYAPTAALRPLTGAGGRCSASTAGSSARP